MKQISKNFLILLIADILSHVLGFTATIYLARILGLEGYGMISYGLAFLNYALLFGNPGLTTIGTREIVRNRNDRTIIDRIVSTRVLLATVIFLLVLFGSLVIPGGILIKNIIVAYSFTLFPFALYLEFVFQGREEMEFVGLARFIQYASYVLFIFLLLKKQGDILSVPFCFLLSYFLASGFLLLFLIRRYGIVKFSFSFATVKSLLNTAVPIGLATLVYQIAINLPPIVLGVIAGQTEVGRFSSGYKIIILLLIIERVFYYVFFPIASRQFRQSPDKLRESFTLITRVVSAITIPITAGGIVLAPRIINFIFGPEYASATFVFQVLLLYFMIAPVNTILGYGLVAMEKESSFLRNTGITALTSIAIVIIGAHQWGGSGAAFGLFVAECVGLTLMVIEVRRTAPFNIMDYLWRQFSAALGIALILLLLLLLFPNLYLGLLIVIGIIVYFSGLYLLKGFTWLEAKSAFNLLARK